MKRTRIPEETANVRFVCGHSQSSDHKRILRPVRYVPDKSRVRKIIPTVAIVNFRIIRENVFPKIDKTSSDGNRYAFHYTI